MRNWMSLLTLLCPLLLVQAGCSDDDETTPDSSITKDSSVGQPDSSGTEDVGTTTDTGAAQDTSVAADSAPDGGIPGAFTTYAGTYEANGFQFAGSGSDYIDKTAKYQVVLSAAGAIEVLDTKKGKVSCQWDGDGDSATGGTDTTIVISEPGGVQVCTLIISGNLNIPFNLKVEFFDGDAGTSTALFMLNAFTKQ